MKPEERLRRLADEDRWADEARWGAPDLPTPRPAGRRSRGLLLIAAAAVIVVAGAGLAVGRLAHGSPDTPPAHHARSGSVIPWRPIAPPSGYVPERLVPPTCSVRALTVRGPTLESVMGAIRGVFVVSNSRASCAMPKRLVTLRVRGIVGQPRTIATSAYGTLNGPPVILAHSSVEYVVSFGRSCQPSAGPGPGDPTMGLFVSGVDIPLRGGPTLLEPELADCAKVDLEAPPKGLEAIDAYPALKATISAPARARAASMLDYTVTLTNRGPTPFAFASCPTYRQKVVLLGSETTSSVYTLNCAGMRTLAPGTSARYAMRTAVPSTFGKAIITWSIRSAGPRANARIYLTSP